MNFRHITESTIGARRSLRATLVAVGAVVGTAAFGVTPASASLTEEVVKAAGSVVQPITTTVAPSPPPAPAPSPPPVAVPAAPRAPAGSTSDPAPSPNPVSTVAAGATKALHPVAETLAGGGKSGTPEKVATPVSGSPREAAKQVVPSAAGDGSEGTSQPGRSASGPTAGAGSRGGDAIPVGAAPRKPAARGGAPSIKPARAAPLWRWFAHVWPAIALGRDGVSMAQWEIAPRLVASNVVRGLLMGALGATAAGDPTLAGRVATLGASRASPESPPLPDGGEIASLVIFSFVVLLALLISAAWVEVRSKYLYH
jgi:hypothetical protein